jgi:hypothetical protein
MAEIRAGRLSPTDSQAVEALLRHLEKTMTDVATGRDRIDRVNQRFRIEARTLDAVFREMGVDNPLPFRDLWEWHGYWRDKLATWEERRQFVSGVFADIRAALAQVQPSRVLAAGIEAGLTGWAKTDRLIAKLRKRFSAAATDDDFQEVGLLCIAICASLADELFDPEKHLPRGAKAPGPD